MTRSYSILEIDPKKYPLFLNIKNDLISFDSYLIQKKFDKIFSNYDRCKGKCENLKRVAIRKNDEDCANISFLLKINFALIQSIAKFWELCEIYEYHDSWVYLQDALDQNRILLKHLDLEKHESMVKSYEYLSLIEKLFPFHVFVSSAMDQLEVKCSLCNKSPFDPECNHIPGNLYWGKVASNIVEKIGGFNHIALVPNPADKRLVLHKFEYDKNHPEDSPFRNVHAFIKHSGRPLTSLKIENTTREVLRSDFAHEPESWPCPCGSGISFKDCCYDKETIIIPHINIFYDND
ncbi:MAG: SEC-C metal-binding domain-containing protein [Methanoregula sp.]